jgi:predicted dehydrogenase
LTSSYKVRPHFRRLFAVAGTRGSLEIQPLESGKFTLRLDRAVENFPKGESTHALPLRGRYDGEFDELARCIRGEAAYPWSADHDISVLRTTLRAAGVER